MATPHISAEPGDFAPDVLMPGDPYRARHIAETFFDDAELVTEVRGILGYTGTYQGRPVSVMASGMGIPSITIYATELARFYAVKRIIRVGTVGAIDPDLQIGDVVAASSAHTNSSLSSSVVPGVTLSSAPSFSLLRRAVEYGDRSGKPIKVGPVFTSDLFYGGGTDVIPGLLEIGTLGVEMEAAGLYTVAMREHIEALMLGTISDKPGNDMTAHERETIFADVVNFALEALA
ncbi:purine-nucleoside phosphorylase [Corynebacterium neomassiliense]|uniref:purine-nucleoside phosphorylase n=1 Tax=Corynebacterium neomassiliense TaxID=2079482 RepID=UPI00103092D9|nr:purine-nucleoside phosphorylase [Corynebacterium neomassiliense]